MDDAQIERYARHIVLREVGGVGQKKLLGSRVLLVGAGGLGSPLLIYLAAAGVGTLGIIDDDVVSVSNLQRQIAFKTKDVGQYKVTAAAQMVSQLNPDVEVKQYTDRLSSQNVTDFIDDYDLIADGSDNFETRFLLNDACFFSRKTLVSAAVLRFDGQISTYKAFLGEPNPCYRCIFPKKPPEDTVPTCANGGVMGAVAGIMGTLQATEVIKELLGVGESLSGRLLIYDGLATRFRLVRVRRDSDCALCGERPSIYNLSPQDNKEDVY